MSSSAQWDPRLKVVAAAADLQTAAARVVTGDEHVRAIWPLIQINCWGREQLRILVLTSQNLYRVAMESGSPVVSECTPLTALRFVVKGFLCYPPKSLVKAVAGEKTERIYGMRIYALNAQEEYRTFRSLDVTDELGMRSVILQIVHELSAAARSVNNTQFFISDYDITLSAKLGLFALLGNALKSPSQIATAEAAAVRLARAAEKENEQQQQPQPPTAHDSDES